MPGQLGRHEGACLCGAVRYRIVGALRQLIYCHCGQCQRFHGNYAAYTAVDKKRLHLLNQDGLQWYRSSEYVQRAFCRQCGSSLFWNPLKQDHICIAAGTLDGPTQLTPLKHVFVANAGDYYQIDDQLVKHPGSMMEKGER